MKFIQPVLIGLQMHVPQGIHATAEQPYGYGAFPNKITSFRLLFKLRLEVLFL